MSNILLTLDSYQQTNSSDFTIRFPQPINLGGLQYNCSLVRLDTYFSWYNISAANSNNQFKYNNGVSNKTLTIDDGLYSMESLIDEIHDLMVLEGDYTATGAGNTFDINFVLDLSSGFTSMLLTSGYTVNFTNMGIRTIFGFNSQVYNISSVSESRSDIRNGVNTILVHIDFVNGASYINDMYTDAIFSFTVNQQPNEAIHFEPTVMLELPVNNRSNISQARIYLTDQRGRSVYLNNSPLTAQFLLKPILTDL
jgi:hypothetical protein